MTNPFGDERAPPRWGQAHFGGKGRSTTRNFVHLRHTLSILLSFGDRLRLRSRTIESREGPMTAAALTHFGMPCLSSFMSPEEQRDCRDGHTDDHLSS